MTTFRDVPWNAPYYAKQGFSIVADGDLDDELRIHLQEEAERGLLPEQRCAMIKYL